MTEKRNNKISDYLHKSSRFLINRVVSKNITNLIIGYNPLCKQGINLGTKTNQNFVNIPFDQLLHQLRYKGELEGIKIIEREESRTSKCSFLDQEEICFHQKYRGTRAKRGFFISFDGRKINADLNGSANIMREEIPNAFDQMIESKVIEAVVVQPKRIKSFERSSWSI